MNIGNYVFKGPYNASQGFNSDFGVIYAIIDDESNLIDVGQTGNINERIPNHDRKHLWPLHSKGNFHLYILIENSEQQRLIIESYIRSVFNPPVGDR